jgi:transketolase
MRTTFVRTLTELAAKDPRINLITGDLGFGVLDRYALQFPKQYLNAGVAEQNMTGLATGMALCGKTVFTYSIGNFPTLRCLEQIRNDICYHKANVKIVCIGGGVAYGSLGISHHATEDIAIMRALPNMTVLAPGDPVETAAATRACAEQPGPCYLRLGKAGEPTVHAGGIDFQVGRAIVVRDGSDLCLISTGGMLPIAAQVADELAKSGARARLLSMHTVKPLDVETLVLVAREVPLIVTLEEHSVVGGLGGAVAEALADQSGVRAVLRRVAFPGTFTSEVGSQPYLRNFYGLSSEKVLDSIRKWLVSP